MIIVPWAPTKGTLLAAKQADRLFSNCCPSYASKEASSCLQLQLRLHRAGFKRRSVQQAVTKVHACSGSKASMATQQTILAPALVVLVVCTGWMMVHHQPSKGHHVTSCDAAACVSGLVCAQFWPIQRKK